MTWCPLLANSFIKAEVTAKWLFEGRGNNPKILAPKTASTPINARTPTHRNLETCGKSVKNVSFLSTSFRDQVRKNEEHNTCP
jgi:hypothetical protein